MKISLAWVFDHLKANLKSYKIDTLVHKFNASTAEIEKVHEVIFDHDAYVLGQVVKNGKQVVLFCPELGRNLTVSVRKDALIACWYLLKKEKKAYRWATCLDWGADKEGYIAPLYVSEKQAKGGWKKEIEQKDYILDIDNKSITHRPDLWGHRGIAREFGAILCKPLIVKDSFLAMVDINERSTRLYKATNRVPITVNIQAKGCFRFGATAIESVKNKPSSIWMASRLLRVGSRSIDSIVDITNYVMLDWGQPLHAFDAQKVQGNFLSPRMAKKGEKILLLDGQELSLMNDDMIIADLKNPVALAGIMGGLKSGVSVDTNSLIIEAANFDPTAIRLMAMRYKMRTEASARFEKGLDRSLNVEGIQRFVALLKKEKISYTGAHTIVSLGSLSKNPVIKVTKSEIASRLGIVLPKGFVKRSLCALGFQVKEHKKGGETLYIVHVPSFRANGVTGIEDIVEEVGRLFGYDAITFSVPKREMKVQNDTGINRLKEIKHYWAFGAHMREVVNYPFFDDIFLCDLGFEPKHAITLINPINEQQSRLVTSLIPGLIRNVQDNYHGRKQLRFFEWARTWMKNGNGIQEKRSLSGILFDHSNIDFYQSKSLLTHFFSMLSLVPLWKKMDTPPLYMSPYQTAVIVYGTKTIGIAGIVARSVSDSLVNGHMFAFELDGDFLLSYQQKEHLFMPIAKYQSTSFDVSILVPTQVSVDMLKSAVLGADKRIFDVLLIDIFEKDDWKNKRSITLRCLMRDLCKTLSKQEIDVGYQAAVRVLKTCKAEMR